MKKICFCGCNSLERKERLKKKEEEEEEEEEREEEEEALKCYRLALDRKCKKNNKKNQKEIY